MVANSTHLVEIDRIFKFAEYRLSEFKLLGMARLEEVEVCNKFRRLALVVRPGTSVKVTDEELRAIIPYPQEFEFNSMLSDDRDRIVTVAKINYSEP